MFLNLPICNFLLTYLPTYLLAAAIIHIILRSCFLSFLSFLLFASPTQEFKFYQPVNSIPHPNQHQHLQPQTQIQNQYAQPDLLPSPSPSLSPPHLNPPVHLHLHLHLNLEISHLD